MLRLTTGLPGASKTINTIREIEEEYGPDPKNPDKELRTIYYYGIPELKTDKLKCKWVEFDHPERWYDLPDGSVIVIDEAQKVFGAEDARKARQEKITRFETHRHQGLDIHLITQHPTLLGTHVRRLVGKHVHFYRPFGGFWAVRLEWEQCADSPEKQSSRNTAQQARKKLPKQYFGVYKSATVHTHKFKVPTYAYLIIPLVALIVGCLGYVGWTYQQTAEEGAEQAAATPPETQGKPVAQKDSLNPLERLQGGSRERQRPMTDEEYVASFKPRVADLPASAPRYDQLAKPRDFPRPYCIASSDFGMIERGRKKGQIVSSFKGKEYTCQCYTQQITRISTSAEFCMTAAIGGYFDDTKAPREQIAFKQQTGSPAVTSRRVPAGVTSQPGVAGVGAASEPGTQVAVVADSEYPSRPWR